ncbi:FKBP-type peptidyl-prolyl cis-trans isomerase [Ferruginibacter albus]|uniref:FKBP-type peptidyl-prolyl cis-trans isomerase n=1 Tax=Ferruginibacter albus TaxID=2875540 RepID=UPI001CC60E82|nr:FKBP-type peptidyl-prolyl cis-trans isomerase [Ferruginibacter albus]UAY50920.1 FKBP-type peptidyl-prolyl cis-trans isomerase [Ferruginibacter albus]
MKRLFYLSALLAIVLVSCNSFRKTKSGMLYKVISNGQGKKLAYGNFFEIQVDRFYKDSHTDTILLNSRETGNQIGRFDSMIPPDYFAIFSTLRQGDSVVIKTSIDSIMKMSANLPPMFKKGEFLVNTYKIINIYTTEIEAKAAQEKLKLVAMQRDSVRTLVQKDKDDKIIKDYLAKNNLTADKTPKGTYVHIITPGEGPNLDTSMVPKVKYTGWAMSTGRAFDSNIDSNFHHTDLIPIDLKPEDRGVIDGWLDALPLLKKGAKAKIFIPSGLGYGPRGSRQDIKPNENLIFDIEIVDVITTAQARAEEKAEMDKQMAMRKHYMDSIKAVQKIDSIKRGIRK